MAHYYKVPAIYEYEKEMVEVKDGEKTLRGEKIIEEDGKRYREVITDRVQSISPDIPPGHSYVCELLDDGQTFFVKSEKPVRFAKGREARVNVLKDLRDTKSDPTLSRIDTARVNKWHTGRRG